MALTLSADRRPDVQRVLDPTLAPGSIEDAVIASDMYAGQAARMVLRRLPTAEAHSDTGGVQRALVYATAWLLADALPSVKASNEDDHTMQFDRETPAQRKARISGLLNAQLEDLVAGSSTTVARPVLFTTVSGRRA